MSTNNICYLRRNGENYPGIITKYSPLTSPLHGRICFVTVTMTQNVLKVSVKVNCLTDNGKPHQIGCFAVNSLR